MCGHSQKRGMYSPFSRSTLTVSFVLTFSRWLASDVRRLRENTGPRHFQNAICHRPFRGYVENSYANVVVVSSRLIPLKLPQEIPRGFFQRTSRMRGEMSIACFGSCHGTLWFGIHFLQFCCSFFQAILDLHSS